jgi:hypothetical protein
MNGGDEVKRYDVLDKYGNVICEDCPTLKEASACRLELYAHDLASGSFEKGYYTIKERKTKDW